ncbi:MAG: hypothetical protein ACLPN5_15490 [Roseiarcus sp.]
MPVVQDVWLPGSFTKNFSWGPISSGAGLERLHNAIKVGFKGIVENVRRSTFRRRVENSSGPDYIPINFFLFNRVTDDVDTLIADELVFQAVNFPPSADFDCLALFAFNFSKVGVWKGANISQRYPALWASAYIRERVAKVFEWNVAKVNADDIESFVISDSRYKARTARKLATNLNYLYKIGGLKSFSESGIQRWWVNALFLALDRLIDDHRIDGLDTPESQYLSLLEQRDFLDLSGPKSIEKEFAIKHLVRLYIACGGRERFSEERVLDVMQLKLSDIEGYLANDPRPGAAIHPTNPRILKTIPSVCANLAREAGFDFLSAVALDDFDVGAYIKKKARESIDELKRRHVRPTMTADELLRITRER